MLLYEEELPRRMESGDSLNSTQRQAPACYPSMTGPSITLTFALY